MELVIQQSLLRKGKVPLVNGRPIHLIELHVMIRRVTVNSVSNSDANHLIPWSTQEATLKFHRIYHDSIFFGSNQPSGRRPNIYYVHDISSVCTMKWMTNNKLVFISIYDIRDHLLWLNRFMKKQNLLSQLIIKHGIKYIRISFNSVIWGEKFSF